MTFTQVVLAMVLAAPPAEPRGVTLTQADVEASNQKVSAAFGALVDLWKKEFNRLGGSFETPRLVAYRGRTLSSCGVLPASNAMYCEGNNTLYFDDAFVAAQAKLTGAALHSDGDMASVGIIAHEMGHAVTAQLGIRYRSSYSAESAADCLAGAFTRSAERDGSLEKGDLEEAFYAMASAADPDLRSTGNPRMDARIARLAARQSHGTREQRQANFRSGYASGPGACVPGL